jgi:hypothetical protein
MQTFELKKKNSGFNGFFETEQTVKIINKISQKLILLRILLHLLQLESFHCLPYLNDFLFQLFYLML